MNRGKNNRKEAQIISFLSGKGGAGKTSVAIGVSYLLNDAGFKVLLIDFDFATNGASYFYKYLYPSQKKNKGIYEIIDRHASELDGLAINMPDFSLKIKEGFYFLPSRVNFSKKMPLRDSISLKEEALKSFLLSSLNLSEERFDFIIIDNQAGANLTAKVSASLSNKVIIVSELDPISSDAVDTLLIQIGDSFPEYRRHLINKLDISESEDYKNVSTLFQSMNRLPPLPFDFEVRSAFASRQIPIDINRPTTFSIALFNTVKAFLPECRDKIEKYGEKILSKFYQYQDKVNSLLDTKKTLEYEMEVLRKKREKRRLKTITIISLLGVYLGMSLAIMAILGIRFLPTEEITVGLLGILIVLASVAYLLFTRIQYRERTEDILGKERIEAELSEINKEIDRYKSLMLTRTR